MQPKFEINTTNTRTHVNTGSLFKTKGKLIAVRHVVGICEKSSKIVTCVSMQVTKTAKNHFVEVTVRGLYGFYAHAAGKHNMWCEATLQAFRNAGIHVTVDGKPYIQEVYHKLVDDMMLSVAKHYNPDLTGFKII